MSQTSKGEHELLTKAGYSLEATELCWKRFKEYGLPIEYTDWCTAYVAVNSTIPTQDMGIAPLDGNVVINAMFGAKKAPIKKRFPLGSYKRH